MSDPRLIPADEAKNIQAMFSSFGDPSNRERKIRDLAATVVAQAAQIERLQDGLREIEEWELTASSIIADLVESGVILEEDMQ